METVEVLYFSEASFELFCRDVLHPNTGCIVLVMSSLVYCSYVNKRTIKECLVIKKTQRIINTGVTFEKLWSPTKEETRN